MILKTEEEQIEFVKRRWYNIEDIKNPSERVQLAAIINEPTAIRFIKNPCEAVQLEAVKRSGSAIKYIKNPSEEVQLAAIKHDASLIVYIEDPSERTQLEAIRKDMKSIIHIDKNKLSEKVVVYLIENSEEAQRCKVFNPFDYINFSILSEETKCALTLLGIKEYKL